MPFAAAMGEGEQCVFCWGAGEDGQLCLEQAPVGEDEWHVAAPTVRARAALPPKHALTVAGVAAPRSRPDARARAAQPVPAFKALPLRADPAGVHSPLVGGSRQSLAVTSDGALFTWGWNQKWSLGLGHQEGVKTARRVEALAGVHVAQARGPAPLAPDVP